jgi:cytoskeletal protein RodZ
VARRNGRGEPPDDPNHPDNDPTAYINGGYGEPPGPPPGDPVPWYRKPAALVGLGALGALLIALIVFGLATLITGGDEPSEQTTLTPLTTTSRSVTTTATTSAPQTVTETVTPTTTESTTTTTTTTTTEPTTSVSTSVSTSTETSTVTETVTAPPPPSP